MIIAPRYEPPRCEGALEPEMGASITLRALEKAYRKLKRLPIVAETCLRPTLDRDFAVALMRLSAAGDFKKRMERVREKAWDPSHGRIGDFSDAKFFDFMSWAQFTALDEDHDAKIGDGVLKLLRARSMEDLVAGLKRVGFCEDASFEETLKLVKPANLASLKAFGDAALKNDFEMKAVRALARRRGLRVDADTTIDGCVVEHRIRYLRQ